MHFFNGEKNEGKLSDFLSDNSVDIIRSLNVEISISHLVEVLNSFSESIKKEGTKRQKLLEILFSSLSESEGIEVLEGLISFTQKQFIIDKIKKELGVFDLFHFDSFEKIDFLDKENKVFECFRPLGILTHILPSNSFGLSVLAIIEGLISKNTNLAKVPKREMEYVIEVFEQISTFDSTGKIKNKIFITDVSSADTDGIKKMLRLSDGISVWGGDAALKKIQSLAPLNARWIPWGHKISFIYVTRKYYEKNKGILIETVSDLVTGNQMACSSPQCIIIEDAFPQELLEIGEEFKKIFDNLTIDQQNQMKNHHEMISIEEQSEITNITEVLKLKEVLGDAKVFEGDFWKIFINFDESRILRPSPLFFTYWLQAVKNGDLTGKLIDMRSYLQTVGLYCLSDEIKEKSDTLIHAGALRIRLLGNMNFSYPSEPHDGLYALARFMKRISLSGHHRNFPQGLCRLEELDFLETREINFPVMDKEKYQALTPKIQQLLFKSGGSSGKTTFSPFSYEDYHLHMRVAAEGLLAAGLNPEYDRVANLYFSGGLYGGFISFFSILESIKIPQFPFAAWMDHEYVAQVISDKEINTLMGMPSYLMQLFQSQEKVLKIKKCVKKMFYGGEHFSQAQIKYLKEEFGVEEIFSGAYGSVDAGPIGFQCQFLKGGVHHLNGLQYLEIFNLDSDLPVEKEEVGRLILTPLYRNSIDIKKYEIGDLGKWVLGPCPCGRKNPRFELLGRMGDIFRAGGTFFNYTQFEKVLVNIFDYCQEFQIIIDRSLNRDTVNLILGYSALDKDQLLTSFPLNYKEFKDALDERTISFNIKFLDPSEFLRVSTSGKLRRVIDQRDL